MSRDPQSVLAVTGLATEARIAAGPGIEVVCSGCDPARLRLILNALAPARYHAVISFGISGALDPLLRPGDIIVASEIKSATDAWPVSSALARALTDRLNGIANVVTSATLAGVDAPIIEAATKARLRATTGAAAVDMESHVAASFGASVGLPTCAIRVVCDPAEVSLPPLAAKALRPDGSVDLLAVLASIAGDPRQIPLLIRAGRDARVAFAVLRRVRALLERGLGLGGESVH